MKIIFKYNFLKYYIINKFVDYLMKINFNSSFLKFNIILGMIHFLILLNLISFLNCIKAVIEVRDPRRKIDTFYSKLETSLKDFGPDDILSLTGKLCDTDSTDKIFQECFAKYENYNYEWIILANNSDYLNSVYKFKEELVANYTYPWRIISIIYNNETISINDTIFDTKTPLFAVNSEMYRNLEQYDISNRNDNYFINLLFKKLDYEFQSQISSYISFAILGVMIIVTLLWHILSCRISQSDSTGIQKGFTVLIYLRLILSMLTVYYVYLYINSISLDNFSDALMKIYVETIIVTLNAVLQTLLWFNILIIAFGWQIHRGMFNREELRNLIIIFISLYIFICFDQIVDMIFDFDFYLFKPSDIKNFLLYSILALTTYKYCTTGKKVLRQRCIYAINFSREYFPALKLKLYLMSYHLIVTLIYSTLYISLIFISRTLLQDLICAQLKMMLVNCIDTLGLVMFVYIYRPRKLPNFFSVFYDDTNFNFEITKFNIYGIKLSYDSLLLRVEEGTYFNPISDEKITKKEIKEINSNKLIPMVIINPLFNINEESNITTSDKKNLLDFVTIGIRSE